MISQLLCELYDFDQEDKCFIIKIAPEKYEDLFNKLDHYPIRKRDINQNVINYIEDCSSDIPLKYKIKIEIKIQKIKRNEDLEERTRKGLKNYFNYYLMFSVKEKNDVIITSLIYFVLFIALAIMTFSIEPISLSLDKVFLKTILEGLSIGSWIFLWEAIAGMVFKNKKNIIKVNTYKRLLGSKIYYIYDQEKNLTTAST